MGTISLKLGIFILLFLTSGTSFWFTEMSAGVEAARAPISTTSHHQISPAKKRRHHRHSLVDCSSDRYCDPFAKRIDWRCKYADVCQSKCNSFDGVFSCTDRPGYCLCQLEN